jgi:hypothetical protein
VNPRGPLRPLIEVDHLHYEHLPGLTKNSVTPDWSLTFRDDVGTKYVEDEGGAYDPEGGGSATHGLRDIGIIPTRARILTILARPSYEWEPRELWTCSYEVDLSSTAVTNCKL